MAKTKSAGDSAKRRRAGGGTGRAAAEDVGAQLPGEGPAAPQADFGPASEPEQTAGGTSGGFEDHMAAIEPMAEQIREPRTFKEWVSQGIENQPGLGWEKKLLARWSKRRRK